MKEPDYAEAGWSTVQSEITALDECLRVAEFGPDPKFFEEALGWRGIESRSVAKHRTLLTPVIA